VLFHTKLNFDSFNKDMWRISSILTLTTQSVLLLPLVIQSTSAGQHLNVQCILRGKRYEIPNVSTVRELQKNVEEQSGLIASKQGVIFGGEKLKPSDVLEDVGVEEGSVINVIASSKKKKSSSSSSLPSASSLMGDTTPASSTIGSDGTSTTPGAGSGLGGLDDLLKQAGVDSGKLNEMMQSMTGGTGGEGMPDMKQSMEMMQQMMGSPMMQEYFSDPEKLEQSRQMILSNPMMKSMFNGLPGFDEILQDKAKWSETMMAAATMYKEMGSSLQDKFGTGSDFFGAGETASLNSALDELSEGDD